uniref:BTB domain-containing protein n=1 Tax=Panagrolaimus davidi TaxID=227884 RepID=A0A914P913_9BILA
MSSDDASRLYEDIYKMQQERFNIFKSQDRENGNFDVTFDIDGKKLFANKFMLTSVSETLKAMLSDRWSNKDEAVKIEDYSYDDFYEFLHYLYTGCSDLTNENVFKLTDMAEYYGVPLLKEVCDKFLSEMKYNLGNIEEMLQFAAKYSLTKMKAALSEKTLWYFFLIWRTKGFPSYKKRFVVFLSTIDYCSKENIFETVYKWTKHQLMKHRTDKNQKFNRPEAVKNKLITEFPHVYSFGGTAMSQKFLMNFLVEKGFHFSPNDLEDLYGTLYNRDEDANFKLIYELAEKQALQKQKMSSDGENFNIADSVKADLAEVLPLVKFYKMKQKFLTNFVVAKGIITAEQASHVNDIIVFITNNGKRITGVFNGDIGIRRAIEGTVRYNATRRNTAVIRFVDKFLIPSSPSTVAKTDGIDWYLCLEEDTFLALKHRSKIDESDYLLAEMKSENGFSLIPDEETLLQARFNNLDPII